MSHEIKAPTKIIASLAEEFAGRADGHDRDGSFPFENFVRLRSVGLLTLTAPGEFGGHGAGLNLENINSGNVGVSAC